MSSTQPPSLSSDQVVLHTVSVHYYVSDSLETSGCVVLYAVDGSRPEAAFRQGRLHIPKTTHLYREPFLLSPGKVSDCTMLAFLGTLMSIASLLACSILSRGFALMIIGKNMHFVMVFAHENSSHMIIFFLFARATFIMSTA